MHYSTVYFVCGCDVCYTWNDLLGTLYTHSHWHTLTHIYIHTFMYLSIFISYIMPCFFWFVVFQPFVCTLLTSKSTQGTKMYADFFITLAHFLCRNRMKLNSIRRGWRQQIPYWKSFQTMEVIFISCTVCLNFLYFWKIEVLLVWELFFLGANLLVSKLKETAGKKHQKWKL